MKKITINNTKIQYRIDKGYYLGESFKQFIKNGLSMGYDHGFFLNGARSRCIGKWEKQATLLEKITKWWG